jgi:uncharacterized membrane protein
MARRVGLIPAFHLVVGVAMTALIIVWRPRDGDPVGLFQIVEKALNGSVAYRDFPVEYPPFGLASIGAPLLIGGTNEGAYQTIFSALMLVVAMATGAAVAWLAAHRWSEHNVTNTMLLFVGLALTASPLVIWRFDIVPALLTALALVAYAMHKPGFTGLSLGLGLVNKVYPAFLLPVLGGARLLERRWRDVIWMAVAAAIAVAAVIGEGYLVAGSRIFYFLVYQRNRGVEIESITGGIAMWAGAFNGTTTKVFFDFGSMQVQSPLLASLTTPEFVLQAISGLVLLAGAVYSFQRDINGHGSVQRKTLVQYSLATLLLVMLVNKVLSPQYIVWLLPLVPLVSTRKSLLFLAISVLTTIGYPLTFPSLEKDEPYAVVLLNARNLLLIVMFVWVVIPARRAQRVAQTSNQNEATFETPPTTPARTPKASSA